MTHSLRMKTSSLTKRCNELRRGVFPQACGINRCHMIGMSVSWVKSGTSLAIFSYHLQNWGATVRKSSMSFHPLKCPFRCLYSCGIFPPILSLFRYFCRLSSFFSQSNLFFTPSSLQTTQSTTISILVNCAHIKYIILLHVHSDPRN